MPCHNNRLWQRQCCTQTHTHTHRNTHTLFSELLKSLVISVMDKIITLFLFKMNNNRLRLIKLVRLSHTAYTVRESLTVVCVCVSQRECVCRSALWEAVYERESKRDEALNGLSLLSNENSAEVNQ